MQERVVCSISSAIKYEVPANIVLGVAEKEAGKPGQWVRNPNGSHDVGTMQFNTTYLRDLAHYGITPQDVAVAGCYPYALAAWRLRMHIRKDAGDLWTRAANYHSRTPKFNAIYRADLMRRASKWAVWLEARFPTHDVLNGGARNQVARVPATSAAAAPAIARPATAPARPAINYVPRKLLVTAQQ